MAVVDHFANARFRQLSWSGPFTAINSLQAVPPLLARSHPQGVQAILIGSALGTQAYRVVQRNGIVAILIGLLLPAVQRAAANGTTDIEALRKHLSPQGGLGFLMEGDGIQLRAGRQDISGVAPTWFAQAEAAARAG